MFLNLCDLFERKKKRKTGIDGFEYYNQMEFSDILYFDLIKRDPILKHPDDHILKLDIQKRVNRV